MRTPKLVIGTLACLAMTLLSVRAEERTYLDRFDQSSPQAVAEAFVDAMAAEDYFGAYYLLSPEAKEGSFQAVAAMQVGRLLPGADPFYVDGSIFYDESAPRVLLDDLADQSQVFDDLMVAGQTTGLLPFGFRDAELGSVTETETGAAASVTASEAPQELTLALTQTEQGDWRVDTISWPGSVDGKPWGAPEGAATVPARPIAPAPRTYLDSLDLATPEETVTAFIDAFVARDYFKAYFLLSPAAKRAPFDPMQPLQLPILLPGIDVEDLPGTGLHRNIPRADELAFDTMHDPAIVFDRLLLAAERQGALPFVLQGASIDEIGVIGLASGPAAMPEVNVTVTAPADDLTFHLTQLPNNQWRIDQITWLGSLDWARPWGGEYTEAAKD